MKKRRTMVLFILLCSAMVLSNRVLKFSAARPIELFSVLAIGVVMGLLVGSVLFKNKE
jgi:hypothetical protein